MELTVYGPLRAATDGKTVEIAVDGDTAGDLIEAFVAAYPRTASQLMDDEENLRPSVRIMVDGKHAELDDQIPSDASVALFPALRGG